jgi:hypothetical protein
MVDWHFELISPLSFSSAYEYKLHRTRYPTRTQKVKSTSHYWLYTTTYIKEVLNSLDIKLSVKYLAPNYSRSDQIPNL